MCIRGVCVYVVCVCGICVQCMRIWGVCGMCVYGGPYVCYVFACVGCMSMCVCMHTWGIYVCICGGCVYVGCVYVCMSVRERERCQIYSVAGYSAIDRLSLHLQNLYLVKGHTDNKQVGI